VLTFKCLLHCLNPSYVDKVITVLPELCRLDQSWHTCVLASFWEPFGANSAWCSKWKFFGLFKLLILGYYVSIGDWKTKLRVILSKLLLCSYFFFTKILAMKQIFIDFIRLFSSIYERKEEKHPFSELNYEFWITYRYYKESTKFREFNTFHWDQ